MMQLTQSSAVQTVKGIEFKRVSPNDEGGFPGELYITSSYYVSQQDEIIMIWEATMPDEQPGF